jgi:GAF domain-containing protein
MSEQASGDRKLAEQIYRLLQAIEMSGHAILPSSSVELLQSIVDAAARIFGAAAASISLINEAEQILEFKVAYGIGQEDVVGRQIPVDKGIAGYVAMTGQPIAVSDVQQDTRFLQDFAQSTGYVPSSILATPLIYGDRVIGVMQVLDKIDAPAFGLQDMELLALFAHQAAIAIQQTQQYDLLGEALVNGLKTILEEDPDFQADEFEEVLQSPIAGDETLRRDLLDLAAIFHEVSVGEEPERKMLLQIMRAFADYLRTKPQFY